MEGKASVLDCMFIDCRVNQLKKKKSFCRKSGFLSFDTECFNRKKALSVMKLYLLTSFYKIPQWLCHFPRARET